MTIISLFVLITMILTVMVYIEGQVFDGVRAYVRGEGLWAKAQKDAVLYLDRYSYTHSESERTAFKHAMRIIDGDHQAKQALRASPLDYARAKKGFLHGMNDPEDCDIMIKFFLDFKNISYMHRAITIWDEADKIIDEIKEIGAELTKDVGPNNIDHTRIQSLRNNLWRLNGDLYILENRFSQVLSQGARWLKNTLWGLSISIFIIFTTLGIWISRRIINGIVQSERELIISESRFSSLNESNIIGIASWRMDGQVVEANDMFLNMIGYTREDLANGRINWPTISSKQYLAADQVASMEILENGWHAPYEKYLVKKEGGLVPVYIGASTVKGEKNLAISFILDLTERKQAEERFQRFFTQTPDLACVANFDGYIIKTNERWHEVLGYSAQELTSSPFIEMVHPDDIDATIREINNLKQGKAILNFVNRYRHKNGAYRWLAWSATPYNDTLYASARDITEQKRMAEQASQTQKFLQLQIDRMPIAHIVWDRDFRVRNWNPAAARIFGFTKEEMLGKHPYGMIIPYNSELKVNEVWDKLLSGDTSAHFVGDNITKNGEVIVCEWTNTPLGEKDEEITSVLSMVQEITERVRNEEIIWKQANFDALTKLPNRQMFQNRLQQEVINIGRSAKCLAALLIDLDRFKEVNDTLGHEKGDQLLIEAAQRISSCVRSSDTVARLGGDEFIVLLPELADTNNIDRIAQLIINKLAEPFNLSSAKTYISASIGISLYPSDSLKLEDLLKNADQAMYESKNAGRNRFSYFTLDMQEKALSRLYLTNELREALGKSQLQLYYQPIVELASGVIHKAEALIRWIHPDKGLISPADFIPLAEETGLIIPIGEWVFKEAMRQAIKWRSTYDEDFQVSVNKSPMQFQDHDGESWVDYLKRLGIAGQCLCVEITEGLLLNAEEGISNTLLEFRDAGMQVAIDDFGTGYSSLSYLKKFDIDYLKIDQSFICNLGEDSSDLALCEAMITMAHKLGFKTIAEGVENQNQCNILMKFGCDYAQGYLFSKPLPHQEFERLLERNPAILGEQHKLAPQTNKQDEIPTVRVK